MNRYRRFAIVFGAFALLSGCAVGPMPSATVTTATPSWEHYFKVDYSVATKGNTRTVDGYVNSQYGTPMRNVQLLVQGLDAANAVVTQHLVHVPGGISPFGRAYFEVRNLPPAEKYNVTVWAFDRIESPSFP